MKRYLFPKEAKRTFLTVSASALMLGAAQAGSTVGINFAGGAYAYYYNTSTTTSVQPPYACGFPVTATAFGVAPANWMTTTNIGSQGFPYSYANSGTVVTGALNVGWSAADCWGTQIGLNEMVMNGAGYMAPPPGNDEVTWGILDDTGWTITLSGLNATFPSGYVIQGIAAGKVNGSSMINITDGASYTALLGFSPIYTVDNSPVGLQTPTPVLTSDSITISNPTRPDGTAFALGGFVVTDVPVVTGCTPPVTAIPTGGAFILTGTAIGIGNLSYQWQHAGTNLTGATFATYTNNSAIATDSGNYQVIVASDSFPSISATSAVASVTVAVPAALTWDADTGTDGAQDGNGTWDSSTANWWNGSADVAWGSLDFAQIGVGGTGPYTLNLANSVLVSGLTFNGNYTITNTSGQNITLVGAGATIVANSNATIKVPLAGTSGMIKTGAGTLTLNANEVYTGNTTINGGTVNLGYNGGAGGTLQGMLTVNSNATVVTTVNNALGYSGANWVQTINLNFGNLDTSVASDNGWGTTINMTGGTLGSLVANGYFAMGDGPIFNVTGTNVSSVISANLTVRDASPGGIAFNVSRGSAATDLNISGNLLASSSGGITLSGGGILQLSGANTYTGGTMVNAGTLIVTSAKGTGSGAVTLNDATTLGVAANGGNPTITNANTLTIGSSSSSTNTLIFSALTSTNVAPIGVISMNVANPTTINITSLAPIVGIYPLIYCANGASETPSPAFTLGTLPAGFAAMLVDDTAGASQSVYLNVTSVPTPPILTWTGANGGAWDINTTVNWRSNGVAAKYQDPDYTFFNDDATTTAMLLNTVVSPDGVTFNNTNANYSLSGSGSIAGFTGLTKYGPGVLAIDNTNTYTGETVVGAGTLQLNNGSLSTSDITNSGAVVYNNSISQTVGYPITGTGTVTKIGGGTLTMTVDAPVSGGITVNAGTLQVASDNFASQFTASTVTINTNATLLNNNFHALGGGLPLLVINHGNWLMNYEDYKQNITMMDGLIATGGGGNGGQLRIGYAGGAGNYSLLVTNSVAGSVISENVNTIVAGNNWVITAARGAAPSDLTISGVISSAGNIVKNGNGIVTLTTTNSYTGSTTINAGTLALTGIGALVSPSITIAGGATFDVTGLAASPMVLASSQIISNSTSTATIKGSVDATSGDLELTFAAGTPAIAVGNGTLTLASGTTVNINNTGSPLANSTLLLIATNTAGVVGGVVPTSFAINGNGLASGATATLTNINNDLYLAVVGGVNTNPTDIVSTISGATLTLSWPTDHLGWSLQVQTNSSSVGLGANWVTIPGSASVTTTNFTIDPKQPSVFFRMVYP